MGEQQHGRGAAKRHRMLQERRGSLLTHNYLRGPGGDAHLLLLEKRQMPELSAIIAYASDWPPSIRKDRWRWQKNKNQWPLQLWYPE